MRGTIKAALTLAAALSTMAALAEVAAGPALATYKLQPFRLVCGTTANGGTLEGSVCVLPFGQTTAPNSYSATIVTTTGGATTTFAVTAGSLPPGLALSAQPGSGKDVITGTPAKAGVYDFTIKASTAPGAESVSLAYEITITVQGPPDQLVCSPSANGGVLESGVCVLPDAIQGQPYAGHLVTSHRAGGALSVVSGSLPPGLTLPAAFTGAGDTISGTPAPGSGGDSFTVQGTGDQGQPLYQAYSIQVDPNQPLAINASGGTTLVGMVGGAFAQDFFLSGGGNPYTWSVASGQLPPGLSLQTSGDPRDIDNELTGTPATAGTYTFTMKLTDYDGQQATQKFTAIIEPPLQITSTTLAAGTVGVPYNHDLTAQGGDPPYSFFIFGDDPLPPGLSFGSTAPSADNVLTGTPTQAGTFSFTLQVQDSDDDTTTATVNITINP